MSTVDLTDPRFWVRSDAHDVVAMMRHSSPVHWHEAGVEGAAWAVLSYSHAVTVLGNHAVFGSEGGSLLGSGPNPPAGSGRMMALSDPPRHRQIRDKVSAYFSSRGVARIEERVRDLTVNLLESAVGVDEIDFVGDVASVVPMTVACELMGVPPEDRPEVVRLCDEAFLSTAADRRRAAHQELFAYLLELALKRRAEPGDDLVSALADESGSSTPLSLEDVVLNCDNIIVGGVQTVRHTAAMSLYTLIEHPEAWQALVSGQADMNAAVEELLRWTSVGVHVLRTARQDTELAGNHIGAGERVAVWVPSANRDESVFVNPGQLDLDRKPNRHLALGWGPHFCIGGMLARMELRVLLEELVNRTSGIEQTGPAVPALSIINLGLENLPVRLHPQSSGPRRFL